MRSADLLKRLERTVSSYRLVRAPHILPNFGGEDRDLEVGCGVGAWTSDLASSAGRVVALDIRPNLVRITREKVRNDGYSNVDFIVASGSQLPFTRDAFDRVLSVDVIEHIPDDKKVAVEFHRVLRRNGQAVVTTMLEDRPGYIRKVVFPDHFREYTPEGYIDLFSQAGFAIKGVFYFYDVFSTIAREIESLIPRSVFNTPVIGVSIRGALSLITRLDKLFLLDRPGGIGIVGRKTE